jgi:hypothetical protein
MHSSQNSDKAGNVSNLSRAETEFPNTEFAQQINSFFRLQFGIGTSPNCNRLSHRGAHSYEGTHYPSAIDCTLDYGKQNTLSTNRHHQPKPRIEFETKELFNRFRAILKIHRKHRPSLLFYYPVREPVGENPKNSFRSILKHGNQSRINFLCIFHHRIGKIIAIENGN